MLIHHLRPAAALLLGATLGASACDFESELAPRLELDVVVDGTGVRMHQTDLDYAVELSRCRVAIAGIEFTTEGEMHARADKPVLDSLYDLVVPTAYAHPGHAAGGEVVGELPGRHVFDWRADGEHLGLATMLEANYNGVNFTLTRAAPGDGITADDSIIGHTFEIEGQATRDGQTVTFSATLDQDEGRRVIGVPFELDTTETPDAVIGLSLHLVDPFEPDTVFDGIDFLALDEDGDGVVVLEPDSEAHNRLRRALQTHDFYGTELR